MAAAPDKELDFKCGDVCEDCLAQGLQNKLRYFWINLEEQILKCESNKCMYPYVDDSEEEDEQEQHNKEKEQTFNETNILPDDDLNYLFEMLDSQHESDNKAENVCKNNPEVPDICEVTSLEAINFELDAAVLEALAQNGYSANNTVPMATDSKSVPFEQNATFEQKSPNKNTVTPVCTATTSAESASIGQIVTFEQKSPNKNAVTPAYTATTVAESASIGQIVTFEQKSPNKNTPVHTVTAGEVNEEPTINKQRATISKFLEVIEKLEKKDKVPTKASTKTATSATKTTSRITIRPPRRKKSVKNATLSFNSAKTSQICSYRVQNEIL